MAGIKVKQNRVCNIRLEEKEVENFNIRSIQEVCGEHIVILEPERKDDTDDVFFSEPFFNGIVQSCYIFRANKQPLTSKILQKMLAIHQKKRK